MKQEPASLYKCLGDAFFDERQRKAWHQMKVLGRDRQYQLWTGYRTSVLVSATGALMQLDTAYKLVHKAGTVLDFIAQQVGVVHDTYSA